MPDTTTPSPDATADAVTEGVRDALEHEHQSQQPMPAPSTPPVPVKTKFAIWTLIIALAGIIVHTLDAFTDASFSQFYRRFGVYALLFLVGWFTKAFYPDRPILDRANWGTSAVLNSIALLYPMALTALLGAQSWSISNLWGGGAIIDQTAVGILVMFFPPYFFYFFWMREYESKFVSRIQWLYKFAWIIVGVVMFISWMQAWIVKGGLSTIPFLKSGEIDVVGAGEGLKNLFWNTGKTLLDLFVGGFLGVMGIAKQTTQQALYAATGGALFAGTVERNAEIELGVRVLELKSAEPITYITDPISVFGILSVAPIEEKDTDPIILNVSCYAGESANKTRVKADVLKPEEIPPIYSFEEVDIDCRFTKDTVLNNITRGPKLITVFADFDFKTLGYIKGYTIERELSRALRRERVDIFDQYEITDKNPKAIHTNGPVMIGMDLPRLPIEIDRGNLRNEFVLSISVANRWPGKIKKIHSFELKLPDGIELDKTLCGEIKFTRAGPGEYQATNKSLNNTFYKLYKGLIPHKTMRCDLIIPPEKVAGVLGNIPVETKYFTIDISYQYQIEKSLPLAVKVPPDLKKPQTKLNIGLKDEYVNLLGVIVIGETKLKSIKSGESFTYKKDEAPKRIDVSIAGADTGGYYRYRYVHSYPNGTQSKDTGWQIVPKDKVSYDIGIYIFKAFEGKTASFDYPFEKDEELKQTGSHHFYGQGVSSYDIRGDVVSIQWSSKAANVTEAANFLETYFNTIPGINVSSLTSAQIDSAKEYLILSKFFFPRADAQKAIDEVIRRASP